MVSFNKHDFVMIKDDIAICDLEKKSGLLCGTGFQQQHSVAGRRERNI